MTGAPRLKIRETAIQAAVLEHWNMLGAPDTLVAAIPNAKAHGQPGLTRGLPDLLVLGAHVPRCIGLVELKAGARTLTDEQRDVAALCRRLGVTWELARGRDEPIDLLRSWGVVR
jgi:hypothetical protein